MSRRARPPRVDAAVRGEDGRGDLQEVERAVVKIAEGGRAYGVGGQPEGGVGSVDPDGNHPVAVQPDHGIRHSLPISPAVLPGSS